MVDAGFTYGGQFLGLVAIGLWARLACTAPAIQGWILARYKDELRFGAPPVAPDRPPASIRMSRVAYRVAMVAIVCQSIGFAIPD